MSRDFSFSEDFFLFSCAKENTGIRIIKTRINKLLLFSFSPFQSWEVKPFPA